MEILLEWEKKTESKSLVLLRTESSWTSSSFLLLSIIMMLYKKAEKYVILCFVKNMSGIITSSVFLALCTLPLEPQDKLNVRNSRF